MGKLITIPAPIGSFTVTVRDSDGDIVYGPSTETNAEFDTGVTAPGDYTVEVDNEGAVDTFCFTISACECPPFLAASSGLAGATYYAVIKFDFSDGFGCPFRIGITTPFSGGMYGYYDINSLSDLTLDSGDIYYRQITLGGFGNYSYRIELMDGTLCAAGNVTVDCVGIQSYQSAMIRHTGPNYYLDIVFNVCPDELMTCSDVTINTVQAFPVPGADAQTTTATIDCDALPQTVSILLVPGAVDFGYNHTITNCCGVNVPLSP